MTDTDKDLLTRAATAAGIEVIGPVEKFIVQFDERHKGGFIVRNDKGGDSAWNPLTDDGDALRLAVKLELLGAPEFFHYRSLERFGRQDANDITATRRAIVRAAAALGDAK